MNFGINLNSHKIFQNIKKIILAKTINFKISFCLGVNKKFI